MYRPFGRSFVGFVRLILAIAGLSLALVSPTFAQGAPPQRADVANVVSSQAMEIQRLRTENAQLRQQITDLQFALADAMGQIFVLSGQGAQADLPEDWIPPVLQNLDEVPVGDLIEIGGNNALIVPYVGVLESLHVGYFQDGKMIKNGGQGTAKLHNNASIPAGTTTIKAVLSRYVDNPDGGGSWKRVAMQVIELVQPR
ncbi:MAG: hypothetical protein HY461_01890 [Parcubacteria group bacterium]|nr:hypothetical protein [Parcubacteria group bacterium]